MRSRTKYKPENMTIIKLFEAACIYGVRKINPMGAGEYNSVYSVNASEKNYVIKIAPIDSVKRLSYEREIIEEEVYYYSVLSKQTKIRVPDVIFSDFSKSLIPTKFFIMEKMDGQHIDRIELSESERKVSETRLVSMLVEMHSLKKVKFGYRQNGLYDNWFLAIQSMVTNLINDAKRFNRRSRRGKRLLAYIHKYQSLLERVECSMVNFDIWPPNIFCKKAEGEIELSWIDLERCFWGDKISDFVALDFMNMSLDKKRETVELYNSFSKKPLALNKEERIRFAIMLGYLGLIMEVEKYARYSIFHFGYWRNVIVCKMIFSNCFKELKRIENPKEID